MEEALEKLEVYRLSHDLAVRIHRMSLTLPSFEMYEEASQIRRSSKRVTACIVEGFTLRKYKALYLNFLYRALASSDETQAHLRLLRDTESLKSKESYEGLREGAVHLSKKLFSYIRSVEQGHETPNYLKNPPPTLPDGSPWVPT